MTEYYSTVWIIRVLFIHSSANGHLVVQLLATVNSHLHLSTGIWVFLFSFGHRPHGKRNHWLLSAVTVAFYTSANNVQTFLCLLSLSTLGIWIFIFYYYSHFCGYTLMSPWYLGLHFYNWQGKINLQMIGLSALRLRLLRMAYTHSKGLWLQDGN
jgi:hypothetical protein